jgi:translation initiation factor 2-alpha kinase 3
LQEKDSNSNNENDPLLDDILVVTRHTQTVRASEPRSGSERWNFSIGHHELQFALSDNCRQQPNLDQINEFISDIDIRVIVPEGLICGYSKKDPSNLLWMHKFDSPIVSVFRSDSENVLQSVDLFKSAHWLWEDHGNERFIKTSGSSELSPSLYLGMYQQQFYIQESGEIRSSIDHQKHLDMTAAESHLPKIPFKPIPAANNALIDFIMKMDENYQISAEEKEEADNRRTELMTLDSQAVLDGNSYVEGRGYYFYTKNKCNNDTNHLKVRVTFIYPLIQ